MKLNEQAVKIAVKVVKIFEGCNLIAYPDPASPLYKALDTHGLVSRYMKGALRWKDLGDNFKALSGAPWTIGYGETQGITKDTVWTQAQADEAVSKRVREFMAQCIKDCPKLEKLSPEKIAAVTSLTYNIGSSAFKNSTVARCIAKGDLTSVGAAIKMWNKAGGRVMQGLVNRRQTEADLWNSTK